jgi:hypothetical protein
MSKYVQRPWLKKASFLGKLDVNAWTFVPLTWYLVPTLFGTARPITHGSLSRGVRCVTSPLELIDHVTLAPGHNGSSSRAAVEVVGHDLCVHPYSVGKLRPGSVPRGCSSELNSSMVPVLATQATQGSRGWHAIVAIVGGPYYILFTANFHINS